MMVVKTSLALKINFGNAVPSAPPPPPPPTVSTVSIYVVRCEVLLQRSPVGITGDTGPGGGGGGGEEIGAAN